MPESYTWNLSKTPPRLSKSSSALHVKMVGWLHDGQNSMPFPGKRELSYKLKCPSISGYFFKWNSMTSST